MRAISSFRNVHVDDDNNHCFVSTTSRAESDVIVGRLRRHQSGFWTAKCHSSRWFHPEVSDTCLDVRAVTWPLWARRGEEEAMSEARTRRGRGEEDAKTSRQRRLFQLDTQLWASDIVCVPVTAMDRLKCFYRWVCFCPSYPLLP